MHHNIQFWMGLDSGLKLLSFQRPTVPAVRVKVLVGHVGAATSHYTD